MKQKLPPEKLPRNVIINFLIFLIMSALFFIAPSRMHVHYLHTLEQAQAPDYSGQFSYTLYDICPCHEGEDDCAGYYACGADKANITYNLDNAPEDLLTEAKRAHYFEILYETASNQMHTVYRNILLLCELCRIISAIWLVAGIIYLIHNLPKKV